jgi:hypothetical protein
MIYLSIEYADQLIAFLRGEFGTPASFIEEKKSAYWKCANGHRLVTISVGDWPGGTHSTVESILARNDPAPLLLPPARLYLHGYSVEISRPTSAGRNLAPKLVLNAAGFSRDNGLNKASTLIAAHETGRREGSDRVLPKAFIASPAPAPLTSLWRPGEISTCRGSFYWLTIRMRAERRLGEIIKWQEV